MLSGYVVEDAPGSDPGTQRAPFPKNRVFINRQVREFECRLCSSLKDDDDVLLPKGAKAKGIRVVKVKQINLYSLHLLLEWDTRVIAQERQCCIPYEGITSLVLSVSALSGRRRRAYPLLIATLS